MAPRGVNINNPTNGSTVDCADSNVLVTVTPTPPSISGVTWELCVENSSVTIGSTERSLQLFTKNGSSYFDAITNFMLNPGAQSMTTKAQWIGRVEETGDSINFTCQAQMASISSSYAEAKKPSRKRNRKAKKGKKKKK